MSQRSRLYMDFSDFLVLFKVLLQSKREILFVDKQKFFFSAVIFQAFKFYLLEIYLIRLIH